MSKKITSKYRRKHINLVPIVGMILGLAGLILSFGGHWQEHNRFNWPQLINDFYANAGTELISIAITVVVIDTLYRWRERRQYKAQLIRELQTRDNGIAHRAMRELMTNGWHADGSLHDQFLNYANLEQVYMVRADFTDSRLHLANFTRAWMRDVNLTGTNLTGANFTNAHHFKPRQLMMAHKLVGSTMPDGERYDGRFNLAGDFELAVQDGHDLSDPESMAKFYRVPLQLYLHWQANPMADLDSDWENLAASETGERVRPYYHRESDSESVPNALESDYRLLMAGAAISLMGGLLTFLLGWFIKGKR
ncbi:MAG: pentapeptide repeat-containing protein [Chloroflexi bacterium]|nr:pentapeptide repeat-containing protein [Chloroflexota bacterium]